MNEGPSNAGPAAPLIEARAVEMTYRLGRSGVPVLRGIDLAVREGETLAVTGASGAGKSTLLHVLGGLDRPTGGQALFEGRDLYAAPATRRNAIRATRIGFVFQSFYLLPELDVLENVLLPGRVIGLRGRRGEAERRARALLDAVGLDHRARHRPNELSGGERQRTALARALMNDPDLVLADEPTGNLDSHTGEQVMQCLFDLLGERRRTLILVTHNEAIASACSRRIHLVDGVVAKDPDGG